ncbi:hypothetical protein [Reichenbachiella sp.]|uniref:hypothetical protein n=1 Tax=Reichenbachiella sp. TaxID=2184521 RepID=UPI003BAE6E8A
MKRNFKNPIPVFLFISGCLLFSMTACEEEDPTFCFECKRVIQTFDSDDFLFLRQEDSFSRCGITEAEMRQVEADGTRTEQVTSGSNAGGRQEFFTTCTKSQ